MKINQIRFWLFVTGAFCATASPAQSSEKKQRAIERLCNLPSLMDSLKVPAVSIAIVDSYHLAWAGAYGVADRLKGQKADINTLFQAASISKTVNALLAVKLASAGKISLHKDIRNYLKSWRFPDNRFSTGELITLADLLSHEAGIGVHGFQGYPTGVPLPSLDQMLNGSPPANNEPIVPVQKPGKEYYSGGGIMITQKILVDHFEQPYPELVTEYVLKPLNLKKSTYNQPLAPNQLINAARGYHLDKDELKDVTSLYPELSAAGLSTTPTELATIVISIQKSLRNNLRTFIPFKAASEMTTPMRGFGGMGVALQTIDGYRYFYHNGENQGFVCEYIGSVDGGYCAVVMTNGENLQLVKKIIKAIAEIYHWPGYQNFTL